MQSTEQAAEAPSTKPAKPVNKLQAVVSELLGRPAELVDGEVCLPDLRAAIDVEEGIHASTELLDGEATKALLVLEGKALLDDGDALQARIKAAKADKKRTASEVAHHATLLVGLRETADQVESATSTAKGNAKFMAIKREAQSLGADGVGIDQAIDTVVKLINDADVRMNGSQRVAGLRQRFTTAEWNDELGCMPATGASHLLGRAVERLAAHYSGVRPMASIAAEMNAVVAATMRAAEKVAAS